MGIAKAAYEECRKKRLEENKKRMEQLNLNRLSEALRTTSSPNTSPMKKVRPKIARQPGDLTPVRRSSRVADKPPPNYKEDVIEPLGRLRSRSYTRRDLLNRVYASDEDRDYAIERAVELQSSLDSDFPSFVKPMLQSHVTGGFWLGLPNHFCKKNLPENDEIITLEDEEGNHFQTKFLAVKTGLSGGWRGFSIDHELVDGDALVFQLVKPTKFKVYIIRVDQSEHDNEAQDNGKDEAQDNADLDDRSKRIKSSDQT